jgi:hypothetical protein
MVLMVAGLMSTVGVYAAGLGGSPTIKTLGGTGSQTVSAPVGAAVSVAWTQDAVGDVTGADVTWTPLVNTAYTIYVDASGNGATVAVPTSGTVSRTDTATFGSAVSPDLVLLAEVIISED